jgi:hypothetical protein
MRRPAPDPLRPQWQIVSTYIRHRDGPRRLEQAFRILLGPAGPPEAPTPTEGSSDNARSALRPCLDRPPGARPND